MLTAALQLSWSPFAASDEQAALANAHYKVKPVKMQKKFFILGLWEEIIVEFQKIC